MHRSKFSIGADPIIVNDDKILLVKRKYEPFKGKFGFPGGFMKTGETVEQTCIREAKEETGIDVEPLEILGVYSKPNRDPRAPVISVAFICNPQTTDLKVSNESLEVKWVTLEKAEKLDMGFDHNKTLQDFLKWRKQKGTYWSSK